MTQDAGDAAVSAAHTALVDAPLSIYERSLVETVDDAELMVWWLFTRQREQWASYLPSDLGVRLFDSGVRSVRTVAEGGEQMRAVINGSYFEPPLWQRARDSAAAWEGWPKPYREALALRIGLRGA